MNEIALRDYQEEAVNGVDKLFEVNDKVVLVLATGAGKTFIFCYYAKREALKGQRVVVVAHRSELLTQASLSFARIGVPHQMIGPPKLTTKCKQLHMKALGRTFIDPFSSIYIGSAQTMNRRMDKLPPCDLLIVDECHHSPAGQWFNIIDHYNAKTLGVTATPCRSDGKGLGSVYSDMYVGKGMKPLIEEGSLSPYRVFAPPVDIDLSSVRRIKSGESKGDYNKNDVEKAIDKPVIVGKAVEHYKRLADKKKTLVFAVTVAHAEHIADEFRRNGYNFVAVSGDSEDDERFNAVEGLKTGEIDGIVNCSIFTEGTSIDAVECLIMMSPISEQAFGLFSQEVGRALRPFEGKEEAIIIDMVGNFNRHGFPEDKTDWTLGDRVKKKGENQENTVKVKTCPQCATTHRAGGDCDPDECKSHPATLHCPTCLYVYPVSVNREYEQVDGELEEFKRAEELRVKAETRAEQNAGIREAKTQSDLAAIDAKLGYKRGASSHKQRAIEEKKKAHATLRKAIIHTKQNVCWGDQAIFQRLLSQVCNDVGLGELTESECKKLSAAKANKLIDAMRELYGIISTQWDKRYSSINFQISNWGRLNGL